MNTSFRAGFGLGFFAVAMNLAGCGQLPPPAPPPGAVVPSYAPGSPIPGGLQIVSARVNPYNISGIYKTAVVSVIFNGAATAPGSVTVSAVYGGYTISRQIGSQGFVAGQTSVNVKVGFWQDETGPITMNVAVSGVSNSTYSTQAYVQGK